MLMYVSLSCRLCHGYYVLSVWFSHTYFHLYLVQLLSQFLFLHLLGEGINVIGKPQISNSFAAYSTHSINFLQSIRHEPFKKKMLKRASEKRHPCLTPTVVLNHSPLLPFTWTALVAVLYRFSTVRTRFALI